MNDGMTSRGSLHARSMASKVKVRVPSVEQTATDSQRNSHGLRWNETSERTLKDGIEPLTGQAQCVVEAENSMDFRPDCHVHALPRHAARKQEADGRWAAVRPAHLHSL